MRFEGELIAWDSQAGYGSIRPRQGGDDVVVGLAAFPMTGDMPRLGEALSFEIVSGRDGRKRAAQVRRIEPRPDDSQFAALRDPAHAAGRLRSAAKRRRLVWTFVVLAAAVLVIGGAALSLRHGADPVAAVPATARR